MYPTHNCHTGPLSQYDLKERWMVSYLFTYIYVGYVESRPNKMLIVKQMNQNLIIV